jgi:hypothetical protein
LSRIRKADCGSPRATAIWPAARKKAVKQFSFSFHHAIDALKTIKD